MDAYRTEEEQLEAIKSWWKTYGNNLLLGIGLAILLLVGWQIWQDHKRTTGEAASQAYVELMEAARVTAAQSSDEQRATVQYLVEQLKQDHGDTQYAVLAALIGARFHVDAAAPAQAEAELRWALQQKPEPGLALIIQQRLARVLMMQGQHDAALTLIQSLVPGAQAAAFDELQGDIHLAQGDADQARAAYQRALDRAIQQGEQRPILKMKLDNLAR